MQETINYNLKKPEANDNVNIDDLNFNFDIIDEKLFAVIQAWEDFKANGGEISGNLSAIQLATKSPSNNYRWAEETHNTGYKIISSNTNPSTGDWREEFIMAHDGFAPKNDKVLGTSENPWKDIYLNGMYRNAPNGYTKLPNGLLLQWVRTEVTTTGYHNIQLPLAFPTKLCGFISEVGGRDSNSNPQPIGAYSNMGNSTTSSCQVRIGALGTNNINRVFINIIAIGY